MALIMLGVSQCAICDEVIREGDQIFATWGVWPGVSRKLVDYCDAPLHWSCYAAWPHRRKFARSYFDFWAAMDPRNTPWVAVYRDDKLLMTVNPALGEQGHLWLVLAETGSRLMVHLDDWERWVDDPTRRDDGFVHPLEVAELREVVPKLKAFFADRQAVLHAAESQHPARSAKS